MAEWNIRLEQDGSRLTGVRTQYARPAILETLAEMRKADPMRDFEGLGRWALSVPFEDWLALRQKYPDLAAQDVEVKSAAWMRFIRSPESAPFKVRVKV